jgi:hypothetical protein
VVDRVVERSSEEYTLLEEEAHSKVSSMVHDDWELKH